MVKIAGHAAGLTTGYYFVDGYGAAGHPVLNCPSARTDGYISAAGWKYPMNTYGINTGIDSYADIDGIVFYGFRNVAIPLKRIGNPAGVIFITDNACNSAYPYETTPWVEYRAAGEVAPPPTSRHAGGRNYLFFDGHVEWRSNASLNSDPIPWRYR